MLLLSIWLLAVALNVFLYHYRKNLLQKQKKERTLNAGVGSWSHFFDLTMLNAIWTMLLGIIIGAGLFILIGDLFVIDPIILSKQTILAQSLNKVTFQQWPIYIAVIVLLVPIIFNIFHLWHKIAPLFSRFHIKYQNNLLTLINRITKQKLAKINFNQDYQYQIKTAYWGIPPFKSPIAIHLFTQNGTTIGIMQNINENQKIDEKEETEKVESQPFYQIIPEDQDEEFEKIIKKWKK